MRSAFLIVMQTFTMESVVDEIAAALEASRGLDRAYVALARAILAEDADDQREERAA